MRTMATSQAVPSFSNTTPGGLVNPIIPVLPVKIKEETALNPKKCIQAINQVDDLNFKLACGANLLSAIHTAIECGQVEADSYKDGLFGAYDYISTIQEEIQAVLDSCDERPAAVPQNCG